jgi:threonine dehydrogenase-like Zn-dependent dehydrogenase
VLVTGAGPIGLLAALLGVQRGFDVHVLDRVEHGSKPQLVRELGATYHHGKLLEVGRDWDVVLECTGAPQLFFDAIESAAADGIVCLTGVSSGGHSVRIDSGALNRELVLENHVVFGSVNANRRHYQLGAAALAGAHRSWLRKLITRTLPFERWQDALRREADDVKTILAWT